MTDVQYKFYSTPSGVAVLPGGNIASGSGISEIDFNTFKQRAQAQIQGPGRTLYDDILKSGDPNIPLAIRNAEQGLGGVNYGIIDDKGNLVSKDALDKEAVNKQKVASGEYKEVDMGNGIKGYLPASGKPTFTPSAIGPSPGQPGYQAPAGATPTQSQAPALTPYTGVSLVDYLNSRGIDSSLANRVRLAQANGIASYSITAPTGTQNTQLLNALKSKEQSTPVVPQGGGASGGGIQGGGSQTGSEPAVNEYQRINDEYAKFYNASGLSTIKTQYEKLVKDQEDLKGEMADEIAAIDNNPWLSEGQRAKQVKNVAGKYDTKLDALTNTVKLLETMYEQGMEEVKDKVGFAEKSREKAFELAQKRKEAEDKLREENIHAMEVNGRDVLVDYKTKRIVADLGPSNGRGGGSSSKLESSRGADGYVDPNVYLDMYNSWINNNQTRKAFLAKYPPKDYVNPDNKWLPEYLMPKKDIFEDL